MRLLIFYTTLLFAFACRKQTDTVPDIIPPPADTRFTWLALGDSYTIGQSVTESERFPAQTSNWLHNEGIAMQTPDYIAVTGWTTTALQNGILSASPAPHDVVSLLIGVNDQYQRHDTTGYRQRFTTLLQRSVELARGKKEHVFVLSIPDYSVTPFAAGSDTAQIRKEIEWFNAINKEVTDQFHCAYLDITPSTREAKNDPALLASDGLHPSGKEYRKWSLLLGPLIKSVLR